MSLANAKWQIASSGFAFASSLAANGKAANVKRNGCKLGNSPSPPGTRAAAAAAAAFQPVLESARTSHCPSNQHSPLANGWLVAASGPVCRAIWHSQQHLLAAKQVKQQQQPIGKALAGICFFASWRMQSRPRLFATSHLLKAKPLQAKRRMQSACRHLLKAKPPQAFAKGKAPPPFYLKVCIN